jgi:translocation and assembly module TamB
VEGSAKLSWPLSGAAGIGLSALIENAQGERYELSASLGQEAFELEAFVAAAPLARFDTPLKASKLDLSLQAQGGYSDPAATFSFALNPGRRDDGLPYAAGEGGYEGAKLELRDTVVIFAAQELSGLRASLDTASLAMELEGEFKLALGMADARGRLIARGLGERPLPAGGSSNEPTMLQYSISGAIDELYWDEAPQASWPFTIALEGGGVRARMGSLGEISVDYAATGELRASLAKSLPLSLLVQGSVREDQISLDASDVVLDMNFLFRALDTGIVQAPSGKAYGELKIRGNPADPELEGSFNFEKLYLTVPDFVSEPIGPLEAPLYFTGRGMETNQTGLSCAGASLSASLNSTIRGWIPSEMRIDVNTVGPGLVPLRTKLLGLDIEGGAQPSLSILLSELAVDISGSVAIQEGDIVLTTGLAAEQETEGDPYGFSINLDLSFGKGVRVYFPDKRLPLVYGQADPSSRLSVAFSGSTGDFSLKGRARLRGGSVFYIQRNFYLKNALIDFNENRDSFDPIMSLEAETRSRNQNGPVLIIVRADELRMSQLAFRLESLPSLTEAEIIQLLGRELLALDEEGRPDFARAVVENSDLLPQLNFVSLFERNIQQALGLDLFFIRTQLLQRWLYDLSGLAGGVGSPGLSDYLDNSAITAGKYFGESLYLQFLLRLQQEAIASEPTLGLDSEISLEWKTPHFLFNWSFKPENPDDLFVTDHRFSFYWRIPLK